MTQRLFIALPVPADEQRRVGEVQAELKRLGRAVRCPPPGNLHLTLKFLGDVRDDTLADITANLAEAARAVPAFTWVLGGYGIFPERGAPRIVWLGVTKGADAIVQCACAVDDACARLGVDRESRPFHPHLTLARIARARRGAHEGGDADVRQTRQAIRWALREAVRTLPPHSGRPLPGDSIILYRSALTPAGARYTALAEAPLHK